MASENDVAPRDGHGFQLGPNSTSVLLPNLLVL
jgi:hypothetical protein